MSLFKKNAGGLSGTKSLRPLVFWPSFIIMGGAALLGIVNNELLSELAQKVFTGSLRNFGWLYQVISIFTLILVVVIMATKVGAIRLGGKDAKPNFPFGAWFAMALTGGIATGLITYGVNEPIIYLANIYGEMEFTGIEPGSKEAVWYSLGRCLYNWTFIPYAMYSICGLLSAYFYFNRKEPLTVTATLKPLFGPKVEKFSWLIDTLALLAIALGLSSSLGAGLTLVGAGIEQSYGITQSIPVWLALAAVTCVTFTTSSYLGVNRGIRFFANLNSKIFYILLIFIFITGPTLYILRSSTAGLAYWLQNFWEWGLDPIDIGGEALVMWWTLYDWAIWIAYAPLMGIFLAIISYGRTVRQFLVINFLLPSVFGFAWMMIWGATAIEWQQTGVVDLVSVIKNSGAVAGLWAFLANLPLSQVLIPVVMLTLILSFSTAADSMTTTIALLCSRKVIQGEEPAAWQKILWGVTIGAVAFLMVAFAGGVQGVDGVKYLAAAGGAMVLFVFILQVFSALKSFFFDKLDEDVVDLPNQ
ncbi:MAG: BCCT family transporter [Deltaproteobacteria bacterium]|jgi:choline-glycine betaine transporter|nr:BCCT family transporter [Deltaproteobacteria bacterium]